MRHLEIGIYRATLLIIIIGTREDTDFLVVLHQTCFHGMGVTLLLHIDQFGAEIADRAALVGHLTDGHVADHRDLSVGILHHMVVAIEQARHPRRIGNDGGDLSQVHLVQAEGNILQRGRIAVLGIDLQTRPVVGNEVNLSLYPLVGAQQDVVVLIQVELLVAYGRTAGHQMQA